MKPADSERLSRRWTERARRPPRAVIVGDDGPALQCAASLGAARIADVVLASETQASAQRAASCLGALGALGAPGTPTGGTARVSIMLGDAAPCDLVVVFSEEASRVRDVALWAARTCPYTVLVIAARRGLALSRDAVRASGLAPNLILSPGGMPRACAEAGRLARRLDVARAQVNVPVLGGDEPSAGHVMHRYGTIAGIPVREIDPRAWSAWVEEPAPDLAEVSLVPSALALARAVLQDRSEAHCCGAWVSGDAGLAEGFVVMPVRVGARGACGVLSLKLTMAERATLQRNAVGV